MPVAKQFNQINIASQAKDLNQQLVKPLDKKPKKKSSLIVLVVLVILLGIGSGYFLSQRKSAGLVVMDSGEKVTVKKGMKVGIADESTFKDIAEGDLKSGGIDGEGSHHLERPGGESQNVYLTSSAIDLDQFTGHKVRVWGETFAAQKAGWLMDVGKLEVLN